MVPGPRPDGILVRDEFAAFNSACVCRIVICFPLMMRGVVAVSGHLGFALRDRLCFEEREERVDCSRR